MKGIVVFLFAVFLMLPRLGDACSMYKLTKNGKTIVGNNEDYTSPNSQFWFEKGSADTYGVMYMGLLDKFAQGAVNEQGLVFDGFWEPYLEVKNTEGKLEIPIQDALKKVMETMSSVEEVQSYLSTVNLNILESGQLVFVDRSGTYLIIEGDSMLSGDEAEKTFSNFYYSQIESIDDVDLQYYQKGNEFIRDTKQAQTMDYCTEAMSNFAQLGIAPTQYTTIYDLQELTIRVHLFHDFSDYVELDLKEELQKGNRHTMIADLFPDGSKGVRHSNKYNNPEHPTLLLEELLSTSELSEQDFLEQGFDYIINELGYEWLNYMKNVDGAIKVFEYGTQLMPNSANLHDSLGEAYFVNNEWDNAITSYEKSLALNPKNENAIEMIARARQQSEQNTSADQ